MKRSANGFTLIEVIVVLGVLVTLMAFATVNVLQLQRHTHIQTTVTTLVADIYEQRQRSMTGDTQGRSSADMYGVYFQTGDYVLFHGSSYSAVDPDNVTIPIESPIQMSGTTFPGATLIFAAGSGEIVGFSPTGNTISLTNTTNSESIVLSFNAYGTITSDLP